MLNNKTINIKSDRNGGRNYMKKTMFNNTVYFIDVGNDYVDVIVRVNIPSEARTGIQTRYLIKTRKNSNEAVDVEIWTGNITCNIETGETVKSWKVASAVMSDFHFEDYFEKVKAVYNSMQNGDIGIIILCKEIVTSCYSLCKIDENMFET